MAKRRRVSPGVPSLLAAGFTIAIATVAAKEALGAGSDPGSLVSSRVVIGGALFALFAPVFLRGADLLGNRGATLQAIAGGVAIYAATRTEIEGLDRLPAALLILLLAVAPLWVALFQWIALRRAPRRPEAAAVVAVIVGVALLAGPARGSVSLLGIAFGLSTSILVASFILLLDRAAGRIPARAAMLVSLATAALLGLLLAPGDVPGQFDDPAIARYSLLIGVCFAGWAVLFVTGAALAGPLVAAIMLGCEPLLTAVLAWLLLGETLSALQILGGAIVIAGMSLVVLVSETEGPQELPVVAPP